MWMAISLSMNVEIFFLLKRANILHDYSLFLLANRPSIKYRHIIRCTDMDARVLALMMINQFYLLEVDRAMPIMYL